MLNVLVAGCGYVGCVLGERLAMRGHRVHGMRRDPAGLPKCVHPIAADLNDPASLARLPVDLNAVCYTASAGAQTPDAYRAAYVEGLVNLTDAFRRQGQAIQRVLFASSTGVYHQTGGEWLDEDSPARATSFSSEILLEGEERVLRGPFPATVVRFSGIYGPGRTRVIDEVLAGKARRYAERTVYLNHIHRDDAASVLEHLLTLGTARDRYVATDDEPVERSVALRWIAGRLGLPEPPLAAPVLGDAPRRGANRRYRNARLRATGFSFAYPTYREGYGALIAARNGVQP